MSPPVLNRRFHQSIALAVALMPLAILLCCAPAGYAKDHASKRHERVPAVGSQHHLHSSDSIRLADSQTARFSKAAWAPSKFLRSCRSNMRYFLDSRRSFSAPSVEPLLDVGLLPKVFNESSADYLTLRQLRL
jgi:hypothetical protein